MFYQGSNSRPSLPGMRPVSALSSADQPTLHPYVFEYLLGEGSYAKVYKAKLKATENHENLPALQYAIKCIPRAKVKNKVAVDILINEIGVLKKLRHSHIVEMISFEWDRSFIYIVMEFCPNGDFARLLESSRGKVTESLSKLFH